MCRKEKWWKINEQVNLEGMISDLEKAISDPKIKEKISDPKDGAVDNEDGEQREENWREKKNEKKREEEEENEIKKGKKEK